MTRLRDEADEIVGGTDGTKIGNYGDNLLNIDASKSGIDKVEAVGTTAIELKVGANKLVGRRYVYMLALDNNLSWGFNTSCNFTLTRQSFLAIPCTDACVIYIRSTSGTNNMTIGEA